MLLKNIKKIINLSCHLTFIFFLASCGFKPIYSNDNNNNINQLLTNIKIQASNKKDNLFLKNYIYDYINPYNNSNPDYQYILLLDISKNISTAYITKTGSSGRNRVQIDVKFTLKEITNSEIILQNTISLSDNYDVTSNRYATHKMEEYIIKNILKIIAKDIRNNIIQHFNP